MIILSSAEENDLTVLKREVADSLINRDIFADKIYSDFSYWGNKQQEQGVAMLTPVKAIKKRSTGYYSKSKSRKRPILYSCIKGQKTHRILFQLVK